MSEFKGKYTKNKSRGAAIIHSAPGFVKNPAKAYSRNLKCICQSGKKIKNCCGKNEMVPIDQAIRFKKLIKLVNDQYLAQAKKRHAEKAKAIQS